MRRIVLITCTLRLLLAAGEAMSQVQNYVKFDTESGLSYPFIYSLNQDARGNILVGTGEGLFLFNGRSFKPLTVAEGLAYDFIQTGFTDSQGRIWLGHSNGALTVFDGGQLVVPDLTLYSTSRINALAEDPAGQIWAVTQNDGLLRISEDGHIMAFYKDFVGMICFDAVTLPGGGLLLATDSGLFHLSEKSSGDDTFEIKTIDTGGLTIQTLSTFSNNKAIAATDNNELVEISILGALITSDRIEPVGYEPVTISKILTLATGDCILATRGKGAVKVSRSKNGIVAQQMLSDADSPDNIQTVFQDRERILWLGTYGQGLLKLSGIEVQFQSLTKENESVIVNHIEETENTFWLGSSSGIAKAEKGKFDQARFIDRKQAIQSLHVQSLEAIEGRIWAGTSENGIWITGINDSVFKPTSPVKESMKINVRRLCACNEYVFAATGFGLLQFDQQGRQLKQFTLVEGLTHNGIRSLFCDNNKVLWVATENGGLNQLNISTGKITKNQVGQGRSSINHMAYCGKGNVGLATEGSGFILLSKTDTISFTAENGLLSNYCESMAGLGADGVVVTHEGGVSFIDLETNRIKTQGGSTVFSHSYVKGASMVDSEGNILLGTDKGTLSIHRDFDFFNRIEPSITIENIQLGDRSVDFNEVANLSYGKYNLRIEFFGISHLNPDEVTYSYYLEGHDDGPSAKTSNEFVQYPNLGPGTYTFRVKAYNADGIGGTEEATVLIQIEKPFWSKVWFIALCSIVVSLLFYLIVKRRTKILLRYQHELEKELQEKTSEIMTQKEMLEVQNKDITDSIRYAKNIQKALLPQKGKLQHWFEESFVFYKPRDIVSGDFYWLEEFGDRLIVACADCTGHGVPGAILAVLGSSILREISRNPLVDNTSVALTALDRELRQVLQNTGTESGVDDGMDIILIDVHLNTGEMYFSSARRPLVVLRQDQVLLFKGDKTPVGGGIYDGDKYFQEQMIQLQEDDCVYLFSDGIIDQFGGPDGKKLKTKGFIEFLQSIQGYDMNTQYALLRSFFVHWKGIQSQVDDILVIGFRW